MDVSLRFQYRSYRSALQGKKERRSGQYRRVAIAEARRRQQQETQRHKQDPSHRLVCTTQPALSAYLRSLPGGGA